jgi:hypothetical protein
LATRGAEAEVVARIEQLLKRADMARFAPANPAALQTDYDEAMQCIYKMEVLK